MIRFLIQLGLKFLIAFCVLIGAARVVGGFMPNPAEDMLRQFECEPQPCWHGIHIGVTSVEEARRILNTDETIQYIVPQRAPPSLCWTWTNQWHNEESAIWDGCYTTDPHSYFMLSLEYRTAPLRFGDMLPLMGRPTYSEVCRDRKMGSIYSQSMVVRVNVPDYKIRIDPELMVNTILFRTQNAYTTPNPMESQWFGFAGWSLDANVCGGG